MLDRCPGCAKEVSDTADECPGCGFKFVTDAPPPSTHGDIDNDPVLDGPASLEDDEPRLDPPASQDFDEDDLLKIQTSGLPRTYDQDTFEAPQRPAPPPKSQAAVFIIAGLCVAAMAASSFYFKHQKQAAAERAAAVEAQAKADEAKAQMAAERAVAARAAELAQALEKERLAAAAAEVEEEAKSRRQSKTKQRRPGRSNALQTPLRAGLPDTPIFPAQTAPASSNYDTPDIPSTDSAAPDYGSDFRVRGAVYDLYTMQPIRDVDIVFDDLKSGKQLSTVTDGAGGFRAHLPINGKGYSLKIRHSRYEPKYLEDSSPSFKNMPADRRRAEGAELIRTTAHQTTFNAIRKTVIERDFMLIPR